MITAGGGRLTIVGKALGPAGKVSAELDGTPLELVGDAVGENARELVARTPAGTGTHHELVVVQHAVEGADAHAQRSPAFAVACVRPGRHRGADCSSHLPQLLSRITPTFFRRACTPGCAPSSHRPSG